MAERTSPTGGSSTTTKRRGSLNLPPLAFQSDQAATTPEGTSQDEFASTLRPFWQRSILIQASDKERLRIGNKPGMTKKATNSREALGLDLYAAQGIAKAFRVNTPQELYSTVSTTLKEKSREAIFNRLRMAVFSKDVANGIIDKVELLMAREERLGYAMNPPTPVKGRSDRTTHRTAASSDASGRTGRSTHRRLQSSRDGEAQGGFPPSSRVPSPVEDSPHGFEIPSLRAHLSFTSHAGVHMATPDSPGTASSHEFLQGSQRFRATWDARVRSSLRGGLKGKDFGSIWGSGHDDNQDEHDAKELEEAALEQEQLSKETSATASDPLRYLYSASLTPISALGEAFLLQTGSAKHGPDALELALKQRRRTSTTLRPEVGAESKNGSFKEESKPVKYTLADLKHKFQGFGLSHQKPMLSVLASSAEATMRLPTATSKPVGSLKVKVSREQSRKFIINDRRRARELARQQQENSRFPARKPPASPEPQPQKGQEKKETGKMPKAKPPKRDMLDRLLNPRPFPLPADLQELVKLESPRQEEALPSHRSLEPVKQSLPQRASWEPSIPSASTDGKLEYLLQCQAGHDIPSIKALLQLDRTNLRLNHYTLGVSGAVAIAQALKHNTKVKNLSMIGNTFGPQGGRALAEALQRNKSLTSLDLSENALGPDTASALFDALCHSPAIQALTLQNTGITSACTSSLHRLLRSTSSLNILDLSFNHLGDDCLIPVVSALAACPTLVHLNLKWCHLTGRSIAQLLEAIGKSGEKKQLRASNISSLDLSWNNFGPLGSFRLVEFLAVAKRLKRLNVSNAQLHGSSAILLAEALKLNSTLVFLNVSDNNMGTRGAQALLVALTGHSTIKKSLAGNITAESVALPGGENPLSVYDPLNPDGHYSLNLANPLQRAVALVLYLQSLKSGMPLLQAKVNSQPISEAQLTSGKWKLPKEGTFVFDFISVASLDEQEQNLSKPKVHFHLDLSRADDHSMAVTLVKRAIEEPGENFYNEMLDGARFEFDEEEMGTDWIEELQEGILEFDYVATSLTHEHHYDLDLANTTDYAVAYKLLERVFVTVGREDVGDKWINIKYQGRAFDINDWRVGKQVGSKWVKGDAVSSDNVRNRWRLPHHGRLQFDFVTSNPQSVITEHYKLDLTNAKEKQLAESLRVRSSLVPGEAWWNERLNGFPFSMAEAAEAGETGLPQKGILEFDLVYTKPKIAAQAMQREYFTFDLSNAKDHEVAMHLLHRARSCFLGTLAMYSAAAASGSKGAGNRRSSADGGVRRGSLSMIWYNDARRDSSAEEAATSGRRNSSSRRRSSSAEGKGEGSSDGAHASYPKWEGSDELVSNVAIDGAPVASADLMTMSYEWPSSGKLTLDYVYFQDKHSLREESFRALLEEIKEQRSDYEKLAMLKVVVKGEIGNVFMFSCAQVSEIINHISFSTEKEKALELLQEKIVDPHRLILVQQEVRDAKAAKRVLNIIQG